MDVNSDILTKAKNKFSENNIPSTITQFVTSTAEDLSQFPDNYFDLYMISFGLRNVPNVQKSLEEAYRVLKPGGRYICLEFAKVDNQIINSIYKSFSYNIIPLMGQIVANDRDSYQYLVESIDKFYSQEEMREKLISAGFKSVNSVDMTFGICSMYNGYKLD